MSRIAMVATHANISKVFRGHPLWSPRAMVVMCPACIIFTRLIVPVNGYLYGMACHLC